MLLNLYNLLITFFILHLLPLKDQRCVLVVTETILILNIEHRKIIDSRELREGGRIRLFRDEKEHGLHQTSAIVYS